MIYIRPFVGVPGSGKDFNCQRLVKEEGYLQLNFADEVREITWLILDWKPETHEEYEKFKVTEISFLGKKCSGRDILRRIGNGLREKLGEDLWIQQWKLHFWNHVDKGQTKFCISDVRYHNELELFKSLGKILEEPIDVKVVFCDYHSDRYSPGLDYDSEVMANEFLRNGFEDGQLIYSES